MREVQLDLPLRLTPLPLLRWAEWLAHFLSTTAAATAERGADQVSDGLPVSVPPSQSFAPVLISVFFSFGPSTARFLFFFAEKKRKWGVEKGPAAHC
jgi:hypothetical protein